MSNDLKIGDNVILKQERTKAKIIDIINNKAKILDEHEFEYFVLLSDLILLEKDTDNLEAYGNIPTNKDDQNKLTNQNKLPKKRNKNQYIIDLHINNIIPEYGNLDNIEIINIQIDHCKKGIELAIKRRSVSLEVIHGKGGHVLKNEVHKILKDYNFNFFESVDGGSTKVFL